MRAPLHEKAFIKHQDQIGIAHCAQPVSNHDSSTGEITQILIDDAFGYGVQITGRLVKQKNGGMMDQRAGNGQPLALPTGQVNAAFCDNCFIAHG